MDMAVGVVIGGAFTAIVNSLVNDVIMPVVETDRRCRSRNWPFRWAAPMRRVYPSPSISVCSSCCHFFLIVALCIFMVVKAVNKLRTIGKEEEEKAAAEPTEPTGSGTVAGTAGRSESRSCGSSDSNEPGLFVLLSIRNRKGASGYFYRSDSNLFPVGANSQNWVL